MNTERYPPESEGYVVLSHPRPLRNVALWLGAAVTLVTAVGLAGTDPGLPWWATLGVILSGGGVFLSLEWYARGYLLAVNDSHFLIRNGGIGKKVAISSVLEVFPDQPGDRRYVRIQYEMNRQGVGKQVFGDVGVATFQGLSGWSPKRFPLVQKIEWVRAQVAATGSWDPSELRRLEGEDVFDVPK